MRTPRTLQRATALSAVGLGAALLVNTAIVLLGSAGLFLAQGPHPRFFPAGTAWTLYLGGLFGFFIIAAMAFVFPKIGGALAIACVVLGQGITALLIDHFGLMGMPRNPVTLVRIAGILLVAGGVVLLRW